MNESDPLMKCRNHTNVIKKEEIALSPKEHSGYLSTGYVVTSIEET